MRTRWMVAGWLVDHVRSRGLIMPPHPKQKARRKGWVGMAWQLSRSVLQTRLGVEQFVLTILHALLFFYIFGTEEYRD